MSVRTSGGPSVSFVNLVDLHDGDEFTITDRGWLAAGGFRSGEGVASFAHTGAMLPAGSVTTLTGSAAGALWWSSTGDQLIIVRGTIDASGQPTGPLLDVLQFAGAFASDATSDVTTALPPGMESHSLALAAGSSWSYTGPTTGTRTELRTALRDPAQWTMGAAAPVEMTVLSERGEACGVDANCLAGYYCVDAVCCESTCGRDEPTRCGSCNWGVGVPNSGSCLPLPNGATCRSSVDLCDAPERCDGASIECPADGVYDTSRLCRFGTGPCDPTDYCDGVSSACPPNRRSPAGTVCRAPDAPCDAAEVCDGLSAACPPDAIAEAGVVCRPAATACDAVETCDGMSDQCPADRLAEAGTECRPVDGPCDVAEACDGDHAECPEDVFLSAATSCRDAVSSQCDQAESCTGESAECPPDERHPEGEACVVTDEGICAGAAACQLGACAPTACDDGDSCTVDACDPERGCTPTPIPECCHVDRDCEPRSPCETATCGEGERCVYAPIAGCGLADGGVEGGFHGGGCVAGGRSSRPDGGKGSPWLWGTALAVWVLARTRGRRRVCR